MGLPTMDDSEKARMAFELETLSQVLTQLHMYLSSPIVEDLTKSSALRGEQGSQNAFAYGDEQEQITKLVDEALSDIVSATTAINSVRAEVEVSSQNQFLPQDQSLRQLAGSRSD